jgi:hypothetical protein
MLESILGAHSCERVQSLRAAGSESSPQDIEKVAGQEMPGKGVSLALQPLGGGVAHDSNGASVYHEGSDHSTDVRSQRVSFKTGSPSPGFTSEGDTDAAEEEVDPGKKRLKRISWQQERKPRKATERQSPRSGQHSGSAQLSSQGEGTSHLGFTVNAVEI